MRVHTCLHSLIPKHEVIFSWIYQRMQRGLSQAF